MAQAIIYAMQNDCNMFNCAAVIASAGCTAMGMINQDPNAVLGCMTGGAQAVCGNPVTACFYTDIFFSI